jgi:uncharacterized protein
MLFLVDGYNLLFQTAFLSQKKSFEEARYALITELDSFAHDQGLHLTLVFDAGFQTEEMKRSHFGALEIIFTSRGQTADDYLVDEVARLQTRLTVVTSDKRLAARLRAPHVTILGVLDFLQKLRKKSRKKMQPQKIVATKKEPETKVPQAVCEVKKPPLDKKKLPPLSDLVAWEAIFIAESRITQQFEEVP